MRFYGSAGYGAITEIWESTLETVRGLVPGWFTPSTITIDVSDSRSAPDELRAAMEGVPSGATVVLSARAQKALIAILGDEQAELDRISAMSAELPTEIGEQIRTTVMQRQAGLDTRIAEIARAQQEAMRLGVPEADIDEEEAARLWGWMVVAGVAIVAAMALTGYVIGKAMDEQQKSFLVGGALDEAIAAGRWDIIPSILGTAIEPTKPFPWGYVVGGVVVVGLGIAGFFFLGEYAKGKGKALAEART